MTSEDFYKISSYAYYKSKRHIEIDMPDNVNEVGPYAYAETKDIHIKKLAKNLRIIKEFAFSDSNIEEINLPSSLEKIGIRAFFGCQNLKKVVVPEGVLEIGDAAFASCKNLEEVYLPNSLKKLNTQMFLNCPKLKRVHLPDGTTHLPDEFFKGCSSLDDHFNSITSIGKGVFNNCKSLTTIPPFLKEFNPYDFKGCKSLKEVTINKNITHLPDHLFDGCINLEKVTIEGKVTIGKKTFKNCKKLKDIPKNIIGYDKYSFENCVGLTSITLNSPHIPEGCFRGCENLSVINDFDKVRSIDSYALDNTGFTSLDLREIKKISSNILSNCKKLKEVNLGNHKEIGAYAFYRTPHLKINLPVTTEKIGKMAFAYNEDTKCLVIPRFVKVIKPGAFAYANYENIKCHGNETYFSFEDKMLIHSLQQELVLYALGSKDKTYSINNYCEQGDLVSPIDTIGAYAFAGVKHLEELEVPSCVSGIEKTAFLDTKKLKTMNVIVIPFMGIIHFQIKDHHFTYFDKSLLDPNKKKEEPFIPFEVVNFRGENINISSGSFTHFEKLKEINFHDNEGIVIDQNAFITNPIEHVYLPLTINRVGVNAFNKDCKVEFSNGLSLRLNNFLRDDGLFYKYGLYVLSPDNSYLIEGNGNIVSLTEEYMEKITKNYKVIANNPTKFTDYFYSLMDFDLVDEEILHNGILMNLKVENRRNFLRHYDRNDEMLKKVLTYSGVLDYDDEYAHKLLNDEEGIEKFYQYVELLKKYNINDKVLYNRVLLQFISLEDLESLFYADKDLLVYTLEKVIIPNNSESEVINISLLKEQRLVKFLNYIIKYNLKDPYLFQAAIVGITNLNIADKFFKTYNNNTKRLIKNSQVINSDADTSIQNLTDLLTLCYITGGLEDDEKIRQKALTFITEKITLDYDKGKTNNHRILGDNFHRLFNFGSHLRNEFDLEFANFFLENYKELYEREIKKGGFIQRAYVNFRDISRTSTADNGSQRHKKVTMEKVVTFLAQNKFNNVTKEEAPLAEFIGEWYSEEYVWERVKQLLEESKEAPRNIFTKITLDDEGKKVFDNDKTLDLREDDYESFGYEWLPKDDWDNFILGKYCNCCAHVNGAGNGIMRASIITDNVQNLVIRNNLGEIVAKSTFYVNRDKGYGVFNNMEASLTLKDDDLEKVYEAFMRGAKKFMEVYNQNNPIELTRLTIGAARNRINKQLENHEHEASEVLEGVSFSEYSFNKLGYNGDWRKAQRLVLAKGDN